MAERPKRGGGPVLLQVAMADPIVGVVYIVVFGMTLDELAEEGPRSRVFLALMCAVGCLKVFSCIGGDLGFWDGLVNVCSPGEDVEPFI